jgi:hypothetical protein
LHFELGLLFAIEGRHDLRITNTAN